MQVMESEFEAENKNQLLINLLKGALTKIPQLLQNT